MWLSLVLCGAFGKEDLTFLLTLIMVLYVDEGVSVVQLIVLFFVLLGLSQSNGPSFFLLS